MSIGNITNEVTLVFNIIEHIVRIIPRPKVHLSDTSTACIPKDAGLPMCSDVLTHGFLIKVKQ